MRREQLRILWVPIVALYSMSMMRWLKVASILLILSATAPGRSLLPQERKPGAQPRFEWNLQAAHAGDMPVPKEAVVDRPDGHITHVFYSLDRVRTDLTHRMGFRPQMTLTVFNRQASGIPSDKPKGTIELIDVRDQYSIARIVKTKDPTDPVRPGDILYGGCTTKTPARFALIGLIDVDRDGKDDRTELKRLIEAAGGVVSYDLPPPEVGRESGQLTDGCDWYICDARMPLVLGFKPGGKSSTKQQDEFLKKQSDAIRELRLQGARPMALERLLIDLGHDTNRPAP